MSLTHDPNALTVPEPLPDTPADGAAALAEARLDPITRLTLKPPRRHGKVIVYLAAGWLVVMVLAALLADFLPLEKYGVPVGPPRQTPGFRLDEPLGTDNIGRSQLSRIVYGGRVSLAVGVLAASVAMVVGGLLGLIAGHFRGAVEAVITVVMDTLLAFPSLFLLLTIAAIFTQSLPLMVISLAIIVTPSFARLSRASTISFAQREFVEASRAMGASHRWIMFRELLPNIVFPVASYMFLMIAVIMVAEGSLSFLGLGIPPPTPSWGGMVASGRDFLSTDPHLVFVPAVVLLLTVVSFNVLGDRVRRRFDVRGSSL